MNFTFWEGKRVFLTGHTGFKGSWLALWLHNLGAKVTGYALPPQTDPCLFRLASVSSQMHSIEGDVRNFPLLLDALLTSSPEIVIHLAAQALVRDAYSDPVNTYTTNAVGTLNLLEAVRSCPTVRAVLIITTDKCYEDKDSLWGFRETDNLGGHDPYSASKACAEIIAASYREAYLRVANVNVATVRAGNVIGGGDWSRDRLVPDLVSALSTEGTVRLRWPNAIRPWQHVLEPLRGYLLLAERLFIGDSDHAEAWNFGPNLEDACSVITLVRKVEKCWGASARCEISVERHPYEAHFLKLDITKAKSLLGWRPMIDLEEAVVLTVEWAKRFSGGGDARRITLDQIMKYQTSVDALYAD